MPDPVAIQGIDLATSGTFCGAVLAPLAIPRVKDFGPFVGFGTAGKPDFWIRPSETDGGSRPSHLTFATAERHAVDAYCDALGALGALGAEVLSEPRVWLEFHPDCYRSFARDPDGNNVEAVCHAPG